VTTSTPLHGTGGRPADVPRARDRERLLAGATGAEEPARDTATEKTPSNAGSTATPGARAVATDGPVARAAWRAALTDRRVHVAAGALALVIVAVVAVALTGGGDGSASVTAGERPRSSTTANGPGAALPSPVRSDTSPTAVALPIVPGPIPTASTTTTEPPTTAPPLTRAPTTVVATSAPQEIAPATVPPPPAPEVTAPPATVPVIAPPTTAAPPPTAPPTTVAPAPASLQVASQGGVVVVSCTGDKGDRVALRDVSARDGFRPDVQSDGPKEVKVRFRSERHTSRVDVDCKKGAAEPQVRESGRD
jgi:hypothetical protein